MLHAHVFAGCSMSLLHVHVRAAETWTSSTDKDKQHGHWFTGRVGHGHAAWTWARTMDKCVHTACLYSCPCCVSRSILHLHVHAACVHSVCPIVHVHASCPRPRWMCTPMLFVCIHAACPCPRKTWTQTRTRTWTGTGARTTGSEYFKANILKQIEAKLKRIFHFLVRIVLKQIFWSEFKRIFLYEYSQIKVNIHRIRLRFASIRFIANNWKKRIWDTLLGTRVLESCKWKL
jgi:hypothetical protein